MRVGISRGKATHPLEIMFTNLARLLVPSVKTSAIHREPVLSLKCYWQLVGRTSAIEHGSKLAVSCQYRK